MAAIPITSAKKVRNQDEDSILAGLPGDTEPKETPENPPSNPANDITGQQNQVPDDPPTKTYTDETPEQRDQNTDETTDSKSGLARILNVNLIHFDPLTPSDQQLKKYYDQTATLTGFHRLNWDKSAYKQIQDLVNWSQGDLPGSWNFVPLSGKGVSTQIHDNFKESLREINDGTYFVTDPNISFQDQLNANRAMHEARPMTEDLRDQNPYVDSSGISRARDQRQHARSQRSSRHLVQVMAPQIVKSSSP
ncbi:hypothetical protein MMC22_002588 [Lobaria immixta]|nr:hypothetical protein [Lobaria immixta]